MDRAVESAAQVAWRVTRAELAALVDRLAPTDAITVLRQIEQHVDQRQQRSDACRWFIINDVLRADGKTVWVASDLHILADELIAGYAACVEVAEQVRSRYGITYHDPATSWEWLKIDEQGASAHYEIGTRPYGRRSDAAL